MSLVNAIQATSGTVGTTSAALVVARSRRELIITNTHASQVLSIQPAGTEGGTPTAVAGSGIVLYPQGTFRTEFRGALAIIGSGAGTTYAIWEI
jgi:hypothetical protein